MGREENKFTQKKKINIYTIFTNKLNVDPKQFQNDDDDDYGLKKIFMHNHHHQKKGYFYVF